MAKIIIHGPDGVIERNETKKEKAEREAMQNAPIEVSSAQVKQEAEKTDSERCP